MRREVIRRVLVCGGVSAFLASGVMAAEGPTHSSPVRVVGKDGADQGGRQPQAAVDAKGRIYVAFGRENEVRCAVSDDGGKTFEVTTVGSPGTLALGMRRGPRVVATDRGMVVTAIGGKMGKGKDGDVLAWRSADGGKTWAGPTRVNTVEGSAREGLHGMASAPDGRVFCTWLDLRDGRMEIFGARSTDGGLSWESDALVYRSPDGSVCTCCHPSAAFGSDGSLCVMWRNSLKGSRDMYFARSTDGGKTFGEAEKLGRRTWVLNACPMDGGAIALAPDGRVTTTWMRAGAVFSASPGEPEHELGPGVQGWTAVGPGGAYPVWLDRRPGRLLALPPGASAPIVLADRANDPVVASAPDGRGPVVAVWEDPSVAGSIASLVLTPAQDAPR